MTKQEYIQEMHNKDRVIIFADDDNNIKALITFFITNDINKFRRSSELWNIPNGEDSDGRYIYIDRLITDHNQSLKANMPQMVSYFNNRFPNKEIVYKSRGKYAREICLKSS